MTVNIDKAWQGKCGGWNPGYRSVIAVTVVDRLLDRDKVEADSR